MAKRKSKKPQPEDASVLPESSVPPARRKTGPLAPPALLLVVVFAAGASVMGRLCVQQQHGLDQLSEDFTTLHQRLTSLRQVMEATDGQTDSDFGVKERIFVLEEAQKQAQETAEVALATSEKLKNSDVYSQLLDLHGEMDIRLAEIQQVSLSVTTLQALVKNQSEEFEAVKESVGAGLSSNSALAENVAGLTSAVASACSRVDAQVASVEALNAQSEGRASELNELKESMHLQNVALSTHNQEVAAIKELVEAKQTMRAQVLEEMLSSVQMTLDEQFFTSQTLHSSVMAHLKTFHTQLANAPSWPMKLKSNEEGPAAEEVTSTAAQNATEVQEKLEDVEEKAEQQDAEDEAEEEAKEEEATQEEQPLEQEVEGNQEEEEITEEEEDISPEEQEDEEITGQSEEQEVEEEVVEETVDSHVLDGSLEEDVAEEVVENCEPIQEESAEVNTEVFMDENEEDE